MQEAWNFFSTPVNLQAITPADVDFNITSGTEGRIYEGKIITYELKIFPLLKTKWVTEITFIKEEDYFIDEQRSGPYAIWHHEHHFLANEAGVLMTDIVTYKLPLGLCGRLVAGGMVKKRLTKIFEFRYKTLKTLFD